MSKCIGVVLCLSSEVNWFSVGELYWLVRNDIDELCVADAKGDCFGVTDGLTGYIQPYQYTFAFSRPVL